MELNLFFSYSKKDTSRFHISKLAKLLKKLPEINDIYYYQAIPFSDIYDYMEEYIERSDIILLFCSENAKYNKYVKLEWKSAFDVGKQIIPIYEDEQDIPILLRSLLRVEFQRDDLNNTNKEIYEIIAKSFGIEKVKEEKEKVEFFRGIYLLSKEVEFLNEIEFITDKKFEIFETFDDIINTSFDNLAFSLYEDNKIESIGIMDCNLDIIPESIKQVEELNALVVHRTSLEEIPNFINEFKHLDFLMVSNNKLKFIPESMTKFDYLVVLDLCSNELSVLPESFGKIGFQLLWLENNNLETLPMSILNMDAEEVSLKGNPLGEFPDLKTRYIIGLLKSKNVSVDIRLSKIEFKVLTKNANLINELKNLVNNYFKLKCSNEEEEWVIEMRLENICHKLVELGYPSLHYLFDQYLNGLEDIKPIAEEILDLILENIEPEWRRYSPSIV